jgi:uncharacterized membrane protein
MMKRLRGFGEFWYDFVVGDDWRLAAGVVLTLAIIYGLARTSIPVWWVMPTALVVLLPLSLWRATRRR